MKALGSSEPPVPRTVKPRRPAQQHRPVIAVDQDAGYCLMEDGRMVSLEALALTLANEPSSFIVTSNAARLLSYLTDQVGHVPNWQYRLTPVKRGKINPNGVQSRVSVQSTVVNFFGWQRGNKRAGLYHYPIDPFSFCHARGVSELLPRSPVTVWDPDTGEVLERLGRLFAWGLDVREWCIEQGLKVSPTNGGLAAQLLRDPRFWPEARRKVPRATNARARPHLPGNYYRLFTDERSPQAAYYLDMRASHHTIAAEIKFPHPDHLHARGHFHDVPGDTGVTVPEGRPWAKIGTRAYDRVLASHGLLYCHLTVPKIPDCNFPPPYMVHPGTKMVWIYTNEVPMIRALGGIIDWVTAAWVSWEPDPGMNAYARWAMEETTKARETDRAAWLKPTLLATYGILAARPRVMETAFRLSSGGTPKEYPAGPGMLPARARVTTSEQETPIVNVIYRGMIEAEQRVRALDMARYLGGHGLTILAIYADSVFVASDKPLPFLPAGWAIQAELDGLTFFSATHFTSRQLTKLPGMPREAMERVRRQEEWGRLLARAS